MNHEASKSIFIVGVAAAIVMAGTAAPASAQILRDGVVGYYTGVGAYLGGACCGPGGVVIGGTAGAVTGGLVYGAQQSYWSQRPPAVQYTPVYPSRQWGVAGSTPMYMRRR